MVDPIISVYKYFLLLLIACCGSLIVSGQEITVNHDEQSTHYGAITLTYLPDGLLESISSTDSIDYTSFFYLRIAGADHNILGTYHLNGKSIIFKPRFVPDPTLTHVAYFNPEALRKLTGKTVETDPIELEINFKRAESTTKVVDFYPTQDTLPENLLRIYIHFSQPMGLENPYEFLTLYDSQGNEIDEPFVEVTKGLWNNDRTRLTVLFHPGRIKRGVGPNITKGTIFKSGQNYTIVLSKDWKDGAGIALGEYFEKSFHIGPAIRNLIDLTAWNFKTPVPNSLDPIKLLPDQLLDHAIAERLLYVVDSNGNEITGQWKLIKKVWFFEPDRPWKTGNYTVQTSTKLEDICGNTPASVFDYGEGDERVTDPVLEVGFAVGD